MFRRAWQHALQPLRYQLGQFTESSLVQQLDKGHGSRLRPAYRQLFSSAESSQGGGGPPKSMLDATLPHNGAAGTALSGTAAARMRMVAAAEGAAAEGAGEAAARPIAAPKPGRSALGRLFEVLMYGGLAVAAAGGYAYSTCSIPEVQQALAEAEQQQQQEASLINQAKVQLLQSYLAVVVPLDAKVGRGSC